MKTIGLIGGMSWESSVLYYRKINEAMNRRLGGHHNARSLMCTVDFAEVETLQHAGEWEKLGLLLSEAGLQLERGGADFIVLCTNTMHKVADHLIAAVEIPLLHIVDATAVAIQRAGHRRVGLLGTSFTMEDGFYAKRMKERFGLETVVPGPASRAAVHDIIYGELCHGIIRNDSRLVYQGVIAELSMMGAEAVILGCTEIELLILASDSKLPIFPSTTLHAKAAVELALS